MPLKSLPSRLASLSSSIARLDGGDSEAERSRRRDKAEPWRRWYHLARWKAKPWGVRWRQLVADGFTCRGCDTVFADDSKLHCDHVEDHKGDWTKFWAGPFQTLCDRCHGAKKRTRNW